MAKQIEGFEIRTMSKSQLAKAYSISIDTLRSWIDSLPKDKKTELGNYKKIRLFKPLQIEILIKIWGAP